MSSGNFTLGHDLTLEGFNHYILPNLEKYNTQVTDILSYSDEDIKKILIALKREKEDARTLEVVLNTSLEKAYSVIEKDFYKNCEKKPAYFTANYQIGSKDNWLLRTIGIYKDDETASKVFQNIAVEYSIKSLKEKIEDIENYISEFREKFENFQ